MKKILSAVILGVMALALCAGPALAISSSSAANLGLGFAATENTGLGSADIRVTISRIINVALGFLGIVAIVIILIGGFTWMTAGGNDEKTGEAKKWIFSGIIGLAIILSAYALAQYVIGALISATGFNASSIQY